MPITRVARKHGLFQGHRWLATLAVTPLATLPLVRVTSSVLDARGDALFVSMSLATGAALCCDALAFSLTDLYGAAPERHMAASFIMWGAGWGILAAYLHAA